MFIVDFSQIFLANLLKNGGNHADEIDINLVRHMVLNRLRSLNKKFSRKYGEMVIACDSQQNWRKDLYPYYKAHRKKERTASNLDWKAIFATLDTIREEVKEYLPYRVVQVDKVEADDIIGTLTMAYQNDEEILIVSADHDFVQLQRHPNVKQFNPLQNKFVTPTPGKDGAEYDLFFHVVKGDRGDGVPNILSDDDTFVSGKRQRKLGEAKVKEWWMDPNWMTDQPQLVFEGAHKDLSVDSVVRNYQRNQQLIDLRYIPDEYKEAILEEFDRQKHGDRSKLMNYMIKNKLKLLMADIQDF